MFKSARLHTLHALRGPATAVALAVTLLAAPSAHADSPSVPLLPLYKKECSSCHVAFPPGMLPAGSWQRLMANLPRHFGTDASVTEAEAREIGAWLAANAGTGKRSSATPPPEDRITRSDWFVREHREVPAATWQRPAVKSAANCAACHTRAEEGSFREREIRIPK